MRIRTADGADNTHEKKEFIRDIRAICGQIASVSENNFGLVCFAVNEEARFFKPSIQWPIPVRLAITGIGERNAAESVRRLIESSRPGFVLTCGFAGGLNPKLSPGAIVFSCDDELPISPALLQFGAVPARFHCAPHIVITAATKRQLWQITSADAVEMESKIIR